MGFPIVSRNFQSFSHSSGWMNASGWSGMGNAPHFHVHEHINFAISANFPPKWATPPPIRGSLATPPPEIIKSDPTFKNVHEQWLTWIKVIVKVIVQQILTGWWYTYPSEKYESQLGWWTSQYMGKKCSKPSTSLEFPSQMFHLLPPNQNLLGKALGRDLGFEVLQAGCHLHQVNMADLNYVLSSVAICSLVSDFLCLKYVVCLQHFIIYLPKNIGSNE